MHGGIAFHNNILDTVHNNILNALFKIFSFLCNSESSIFFTWPQNIPSNNDKGISKFTYISFWKIINLYFFNLNSWPRIQFNSHNNISISYYFISNFPDMNIELVRSRIVTT